ncbi:MAG: NAD(P)-binding protein [Candidatus Cybelea sp.]
MSDSNRAGPRRDTELGMFADIPRRDFLDGIAIGIGALVTGSVFGCPASAAASEAQDAPGYYPPELAGMRGDHSGSFATSHKLRDGDFWNHSTPAHDTGETYDLAIVGAGLSGLATAHFYLQQEPSARILILDNHDDFGGHAKRNEFHVDGRMLLANGGTYAIESPFPYSQVARGLMDELGIDPAAFAENYDRWQYYKGLDEAVFFDRETFGTDALVTGYPGRYGGDSPNRKAWEAFAARTPLSPIAQKDLVRVETAAVDYLPGLTDDAKKDRLSRMSYETFLREVIAVSPELVPFYKTRTWGLFGTGIDAVSALDCWGLGFPGFTGMHLVPGAYPRMGFTAKGSAIPNQPPYDFHFPDGNASIARMLVRRMIPGALSGSTPQDIVTARADYRKLDDPRSAVRIRLSSTVVRVRHLGDPATAAAVQTWYASAGNVYTFTSKHVVMASWNMMIPYVIPELPDEQKTALRYGAKVPLMYTVVAVRNWRVFKDLSVAAISTPAMFHNSIRLDNPVDIGSYRSPNSANEPILVRLERTPCYPGLSERDQHRVGRAELLTESFETFERSIRDQLQRVLGAGGFRSDRDVAAITVNRWAHGYAYEYNPLWDPDSFFNGGVTPCERARRRFGRIAIANSDAAAAAYTDQAIDQAYRAVRDVLAQ